MRPPTTSRFAVFSALLAGMALAALESTSVATALPSIAKDLGTADDIAWVATSYLLAATAGAPISGKLGDLYGRKVVFRVAIVVFVIGSLCSASAGSMAQLVGARSIQGLGGGGLIVVGQGIIADVVSPRERGRYQGLFGGVFGGASILGPLVGGALTDALSWRWVFLANVPVGIVVHRVTGKVLPASARRPQVRLDVLGGLLLATSTTGIVLLTAWGGSVWPWTSGTIRGVVLVVVVLVAAFVLVEARTAEPLLPLRLFRLRTFVVGSTIALAIGGATFGAMSYMPLFMQIVHDTSASGSAIVLVPMMSGVVAASIVTGYRVSVTTRYRFYPLAGVVAVATGVLVLSQLRSGSSQALAATAMVLIGIGVGTAMQIVILVVQNEVAFRDLGIATSAIHFFRSIGGVLCVSIVGAVFTARLSPSAAALIAQPDTGETGGPQHAVLADFADALTGSFVVLLPPLLAAALAALAIREVPLRTTIDDPTPDATPDDASADARREASGRG